MMNEKHWLYKLTAWTVTLGLLLQSFPIWWGLTASPVAAENGITAVTATTAVAPTSPLTISRSQSSYASGDGLVVTYAIHNSLPPTQAPDVVPGQTLTDTLAALGNFDPLADPNSLRQVILVVEPTAATFVNASLPASLDNGVYTFHLDDIPPLGKAVVTLELDGPGGVTEPTELDSGAAGWGMVNGRAYQAAAPPAILWPDSMGDWLTCTVDANCQDEYVIAQAAALGQEPAALFTFVRDLPFESYSGSLRGARGALWSAAGNSVDQASLLIALLRASGVPARYRSGDLANPEIETLILSMFPAPLGVVGYLPDDNPFPLADPLQNPALWNEIRDHYFVEAYLPGLGWTDLDPSFAAAQIGDRFVNEPDPAALSELPANLRHSVAVRVKVEKYHPLSGLTHSYPLDHSFSAVELVGEPVTFGHLVQTQNQGGLIFANIFHTYTPYLMLADADALLEGEPFQELITNFPLGTSIVTGEWLEIELRQPDGTVELHEREIYDAVGYDGRFNGGTISIGDSGRTNQPIVSELTLFTALFAPSFVPVAAIDSEFAEAATAVTAGQSAYERVNEIMADGQVSPDETDDLIAAAKLISRMTRASQRVLLMQHAAAADFGTRRLGDAFLMRPYYDAPRVHLMAWETNTISGQQTVNLDLRRNKIRALPYPGQSLRGWQAFNVSYGLAAMSLESDLLQRFSPDAPVKSVANILTAAQEQNIPLVTITAANLQELADLTISDEAKARITVDLFYNPNHFVIVPAAPVTLGDEETVGWLRSDILSGETIDVSEEGLHLVAIEYSILLNASIQEIGFAIAGFGQGFAGFTFVFLGEFLAGIPGDMKAAWDAALAAATQWASDTAELIAENMEHDWVEAFLNGAGLHGGGEVSGPGGLSFEFGEFDWRFGGFNNGAAKAASVIGSADPPLPPALAARLPEHQFYRPAVGVMNVTGSGGTAVNATLNLDSLNVQGTLTAAWENSAQSGLRFQQLNGQGELWVNGNSVGAGSVVAHNGYMETSSAIAYESVGTGGMGFYAPAVAGLGSGAFWGETAVTLTPDTTAQLSLRGATAVLNGQVYTGTMSLVTTNSVALQASGPAAAPHFANAASLTASGATLGLPPTAANITVGGTAVSLENGLALPNFNGTIGVTEANATQDAVALNGDAHYFQLALDPPVSTTPGQTAAFQAEITANFSDSYTVTLSAPGWAASVAPDGGLTVTPPLTAAPGDYTVVVTAQSHLYPTAVAAAEQVVTVEPIQGVDVTIQPDPVYTIPWGESDGPEGATNNGQVQIPNAAYTVEIVNRSSQPHTFDVNVSGLNPDWLIFAGGEGQTTTQVTLPAGVTTWIGLYVRPATAVLPAPGTSVPFTVTAVAQADPDVNDSDNATFVMAAVPFQRLWAAPAALFAMSGATAEFNLYLRNLGNAPGSFALTPHLPEGWQLAGLQSPLTVNPGQTAGQLLTLDIPAATLGRVYRVSFASPVPGQVYTQWTTLNVRIVSANSAPIFEAAVGCLADEATLAAALHALALALAALEESCENGCSLTLRGQVVAAAEQAADYGRLISPLGQTHADLTAAAAHLAAQSGDAAILDALPLLTTAVTNMEQELCAILSYRPTLRLTPWLDAALPGQPINYDLQLTNRGTLTTSYAVTVTLPGETLTFEQTVPPGAALTTAVAASSPDLGLYLIQAEARALDAPIDYLTAQAEARLNVVERFIQVTAVTADPPFVETGDSETTLQVEIANAAGIGLSSVVETAVYAPNGALQWSGSIPLNILGGSPRLYDLAEVNTSGWTAGVYTITADVQLQGQPTAGGAGYGYLSVGQAVIPSHAVNPELVAPGTVTVTTTITAEINQSAAVNSQPSAVGGRRSTIYDAPYWDVQELADRPFINVEATDLSELSAVGPPPAPVAEIEMVEETAVTDEEIGQPLTFTHPELPATEEEAAPEEAAPEDESAVKLTESAASDESISDESLPFTLLNFPPAFTRLEENDPAILYTGTWSNLNLNQASGGAFQHSATTGSTAELTFNGSWLHIGFLGGTSGGLVEITINGDSQGLFDLYRRTDNTPLSFYFGDLGVGPHTVTLTVTGDKNPFSLNSWVRLDYFDFGDGSALPGGAFEHDDPRVSLSNNWVPVTYAGASEGGYVRSTLATAWFPFSGDSFSLESLAYTLGGRAQLFVDGQYLDTISFYHPNAATAAISRTFAYEGFGPGTHILQVMTYRDNTTIDTITAPGQPPFIDPDPAPGSVNRYEEDHPTIRYNGAPYRQTAQSWSRQSAAAASDGQYMRSHTANDTIGFDFEGSWVNLGFHTDRWGGYAEIFINGDSQGVVDLYRREDNTAVSVFFGDLPLASHTISVTVLGDSNPFALANRVQFDYVDFGDGAGLDQGTVEEDDGRILRAGSWIDVSNANASGGSFIRSGNGNIWLHFEGDSFTYQAMAYNLANRARLYVNGDYLDTVDLFHPNALGNAITRTFSYEGFGPGPHLLQISAYRGQTTLDAITTPGVGPFIDPNPPVVGIVRFEEDHPAIRYNGAPFTQTNSSWTRVDSIFSARASDGQYIHSSVADNTISFDFEGSWIGVGFATNRFSGEAEIAIDGNVMAVVDLYTREDDTESFYFSNLGEGAHTITITVLGTRHPNATNSHVYLDYFDVWDGLPLPEGTFEETDERVFYSAGWSQVVSAEASGGAFASSGASNSTAWFPFTGDSITFAAWTAGVYHSLEIKIDGVSQGHFNTFNRPSESRAFSFADLGDGPHVLEVRRYRGSVTVDAFTTPATGEHYELPEPTGVIRLEEDHPDLRYNGYPFRQMPQSWSSSSSLFQASGEYYASAGTGNTFSLEFEGSWVGVGFISGGVVEIFINGESRGTYTTTVPTTSGGISSVYFDDLITGTHTISITAVSGALRPDFIDIWDGQPLEDGWYNATLNDYSGRFHYSNKQYVSEYPNQYAYQGDFVHQNLVNANPNIWFTFVGNDLTLLSRNGNNALLQISIDGQYRGEYNMTAQYSNQPYVLHFPDLGDGPHVVQIHTRNWGIIDAFEVNPADFYSYTPQIIWHDNSAKEQLDPAFGTGFLTTIGIGDLNGDGNVELVAPGVNGRLYVYRGDGQDTGDGTPLLWTSDAVGVAAEPALADLTGDGAAEIIVSGYYGIFAFRHDGVILWHEESVKAYSGDGGGRFGWGGPTVGNLDNDPQPEIVIAASQDALYVLDHQGNILDSDPIGRWPSVPVLADMTGDGTLDIIAAQGHTMKLYSYDPLDGLEIVWTYTLTQTSLRSGVFGSPAVADITGDGQPEIIINWGHRVEAIKADGSLLWSYYTGDDAHYRPSPITVADVTGDGQMNLITASAISGGFLVFDHNLMVLTREGVLVWEQTVRDNTASASGVAAQDLTGDGVWEIMWNGATDGFLIIRGHDGKRLFNEPFTGSGTIMEYPTMGDVDGDGVADVVVAGREGIFVISHVGRWINSRPLWNQHNYHVTNINDDWSIPLVQPNSWELHNTYRTQTPEQNPAPSYRIEITHTVGVSNVVVLTDTFSASPAGTPPQYSWRYNLEWYAPVNTITFASELADMQPGETRQINQGTEIGYRLPSGWNYLTLPPLYVTAARILTIAPDEQTAPVGSTAVYTVTLSNPGLTADLYSLSVEGLPADWLTFPAQVNIPAQSSVDVFLQVTAPPDAAWTEWPFLVTAVTGSGGQDMATAALTLFNGLEIAIDPLQRTAPTGTAVTYTLTLTNSQQSAVVAQLSAVGLALVELPNEVEIPAETAVTIPITVTSAAHGPQPFSVTAAAPGGQDTASAVLVATGHYAVGLALDPESEVGGPGTTAAFTLTVTNLGDAPDGYDLSLAVPAGWTAALDANGTPVSSLSLPPHIFNSADLRLRITPDLMAVPGDYDFSVTAVSHTRPGVQATITGTVEILPLGVTISIDPAQRSMSPLDTAVWQVTITNTGSVADSYDLAAAGVVGLTAEFSADTVTLNPGQSQTVQMSAGPMPLALPQAYLFWVTAVSQMDDRIAIEAEAAITFTGYEGVEIGWLPVSQTVTNTLTANFLLVISNTGNIPTTYDLTLQTPGLTSLFDVPQMSLPAGATAVLPVTVWAGAAGTYELTAVAQSDAASDSAQAELIIIIEEVENQPPVVTAGPDRTVVISDTIADILATFTDPDPLDTHTAVIDWGDGTVTAGTVDQTAQTVGGAHAYAELGVYTVTVTVTDNDGGVGQATLLILVEPYRLYLPVVLNN